MSCLRDLVTGNTRRTTEDNLGQKITLCKDCQISK
uniref:Uncharacterized protein n=1 Tax=Anguilla anguilla TaxID=7936 RepID=A0A0E9XGQ2_ANGAN